jgi:muramoyltetrapeptide carboxypeptidase LdcA involved in peptidoglycan recycling
MGDNVRMASGCRLPLTVHHCSTLKVPAAYGFSFGREARQMTLPLGIQAQVDTDAGNLALHESAVEQVRPV